MFLVVAIEASAPQAHAAQCFGDGKAFPLHHCPCLLVDAVAPLPLLDWRDSFTRLKAPLKKSSITVCWPTLRSNCAMCWRSCSVSLLLGLIGFGIPGGRPAGRLRPASPSFR